MSDVPITAPAAGVFDDAALEYARVQFAHPVGFMMGCAKIEQLPEPDLPEVD